MTDYPIKRDITGAYLRIEREGKWQALDVSDLTHEELTTVMADWTPDRLIMWLSLLVTKVRELDKVLSDNGFERVERDYSEN